MIDKQSLHDEMIERLDNLPQAMRDRDQWVIWSVTKHPIDPKEPYQGSPAAVDDPKTWSSFDKARESLEKHKRYRGSGYVFTEDDGLVGIDLDGVRDPETGDIDKRGQAVVDRLDSYTEISQSGKGLHIIIEGKKPGDRCRTNEHDWIEMYETRRYFALTGNLLDDDHTEIRSRQPEVEWLYNKVFGEPSAQGNKGTETEQEPAAVDVVLAPGADPPEDKLAELLEDDDFEKVWEHRARLKSMSDYDWELSCAAIEANWENQEIADLIIAFRRQHGKADDLAKALRKDYIPNTIAKARAGTRGAGVLGLLPFKVVKVLQYGEQDSEIFLVLDSGKQISMGTTDRYVSPRLAQARLVENQLGLSSKALKRWNEIILALQPLMEIVETTTREDDASSWLQDYISRRVYLPRIDRDGDIAKIFGSGRNSIADDRDGCLYLRLSDVTRYCRVHTGMPNVNTKTVARDLIRLGFAKRKIRIEGEKQIRLWVSGPGFTEVGEDEE